MKRSLDPGDRLDRGERRGRRPGGLFTVVEVQVLAIAAAVLLGALLVRPGQRPAAITPAQLAWWPAKAASLERRLQENPGDHAARVRLGSVRIGTALTQAQRSYPNEDSTHDVHNELYRRHVAAALTANPDVIRAERDLRRVAREAPDRPLRARAWVSLSLLYSLVGDDRRQHDSLAAAHREEPLPEYRQTLAILRARGARGGAIE